MKKIDTRNMTKKEWSEARKKGIGGSDVASVLGLNPWKSAVRVYLEKIGEGEEIPDNERMRVGRDLEDYVATRFSEATGKKVRRNNFILQAEEHPFMLANIDREVVGENAILECKTTNSFAKADWENGQIPVHYELQCHHYMAVGGYEKVYIAVLIGNEAFLWHEIKRDEELIAQIIAKEKDFWENHVLAKNPPAPDGTKDFDEVLKLQYLADDSLEEVELNLDRELSRLEEIKSLKSELEAEEKELEQMIKLSLKEATRGRSKQWKVTYKEQSKDGIDSKRLKAEMPEVYEKYKSISKFRVLRRTKLKED